nr:metacaspase-9 [Ipomoea batatas]
MTLRSWPRIASSLRLSIKIPWPLKWKNRTSPGSDRATIRSSVDLILAAVGNTGLPSSSVSTSMQSGLNPNREIRTSFIANTSLRHPFSLNTELFSGHGILIESLNEEAILGHDLNVITSVDFRHIVKGVPRGATFTILSDSCHKRRADRQRERADRAVRPSTTCGNETPEPPPKHASKIRFLSKFLLRHLSSITKINHAGYRHRTTASSSSATTPASASKQVDKRPEASRRGRGDLVEMVCQANEVSRDVPTKEGQPPRGAFSYAVETCVEGASWSS